jgi:peptidoglycan/LPS O-acetylase OafA/YrhL
VSESNRAAAGVALYAALTAAWIYGIANTSLGESGSAGPVWLAVLGAIHVAAGFVVRRWWALLLPVLAVLLAVPAGFPPVEKGEPFPIWLTLALFALPEALPVALGVFAARRRAS